jgi:aspartate 1-decarboxylase
VIVSFYAFMSDAEVRLFKPCIMHVDADNRVVGLGNDPASAGGLADLGWGDGRA